MSSLGARVDVITLSDDETSSIVDENICCKCDAKLKTVDELEVHVSTEHLQCAYCSSHVWMPTESELRRHLDEIHPNQPPKLIYIADDGKKTQLDEIMSLSLGRPFGRDSRATSQAGNAQPIRPASGALTLHPRPNTSLGAASQRSEEMQDRQYAAYGKLSCGQGAANMDKWDRPKTALGQVSAKVCPLQLLPSFGRPAGGNQCAHCASNGAFRLYLTANDKHEHTVQHLRSESCDGENDLHEYRRMIRKCFPGIMQKPQTRVKPIVRACGVPQAPLTASAAVAQPSPSAPRTSDLHLDCSSPTKTSPLPRSQSKPRKSIRPDVPQQLRLVASPVPIACTERQSSSNDRSSTMKSEWRSRTSAVEAEHSVVGCSDYGSDRQMQKRQSNPPITDELRCQIAGCTVRVQARVAMRRHAYQHLSADDKIHLFLCEVGNCDFGAPAKKNIEGHIESEHGDNYEGCYADLTTVISDQLSTKLVVCFPLAPRCVMVDLRENSFQQSIQLSDAMKARIKSPQNQPRIVLKRVHSPVNDVVCKLCRAVLSADRAHLRKSHLYACHIDEGAFKCPICDRRFKHPQNVRPHAYSAHKKSIEAVLAVPEKKISDLLRACFGAEPNDDNENSEKNVEKKTSNKQSMIVKLKNERTEKPKHNRSEPAKSAFCAICNKAIVGEKAEHLSRTHLVNPFGCTLCSYKSNCESSVEQHIRNKHRSTKAGIRSVYSKAAVDEINAKCFSSERQKVASESEADRSNEASDAVSRRTRRLDPVIVMSDSESSKSDEDESQKITQYCRSCEKDVSSPTDHIFDTHLRKTAYECPVCVHQSISQRDAMKHIKTKHVGSSAQPTDVTQRFAKKLAALRRECFPVVKNSLRAHPPTSDDSTFQRSRHSTEKPKYRASSYNKECRRCKETPVDRYVHIYKRHLNKPIFLCSACDHTASDLIATQRHIKMTHRSLRHVKVIDRRAQLAPEVDALMYECFIAESESDSSSDSSDDSEPMQKRRCRAVTLSDEEINGTSGARIPPSPSTSSIGTISVEKAHGLECIESIEERLIAGPVIAHQVYASASFPCSSASIDEPEIFRSFTPEELEQQRDSDKTENIFCAQSFEPVLQSPEIGGSIDQQEVSGTLNDVCDTVSAMVCKMAESDSIRSAFTSGPVADMCMAKTDEDVPYPASPTVANTSDACYYMPECDPASDGPIIESVVRDLLDYVCTADAMQLARDDPDERTTAELDRIDSIVHRLIDEVDAAEKIANVLHGRVDGFIILEQMVPTTDVLIECAIEDFCHDESVAPIRDQDPCGAVEIDEMSIQNPPVEPTNMSSERMKPEEANCPLNEIVAHVTDSLTIDEHAPRPTDSQIVHCLISDMLATVERERMLQFTSEHQFNSDVRFIVNEAVGVVESRLCSESNLSLCNASIVGYTVDSSSSYDDAAIFNECHIESIETLHSSTVAFEDDWPQTTFFDTNCSSLDQVEQLNSEVSNVLEQLVTTIEWLY